MKNGELDGIAAVQNDSAGRQARLVIRLKRDANANVVLNKLYKNTPLQTTFAVNMPRARRRRAAHAQPGPGAHATTSRTRSTSSRGARSSACARPRPAPTSSRACCKAIDMLDAVIAAIRGSDDRPAARDRR